jgi:hypothetical protein
MRGLRQSASRRRAEAALWRAAQAEGLAQSKTLRLNGAIRKNQLTFLGFGRYSWAVILTANIRLLNTALLLLRRAAVGC